MAAKTEIILLCDGLVTECDDVAFPSAGGDVFHGIRMAIDADRGAARLFTPFLAVECDVGIRSEPFEFVAVTVATKGLDNLRVQALLVLCLGTVRPCQSRNETQNHQRNRRETYISHDGTHSLSA